MGKKQKKVKENQTNKEIKHVNERHQNGLYSDAELTEKDKQSKLYDDYLKVKGMFYRKQFLHKKKDLPQWGEIELKKLTEIMQDRNRRIYNNNRQAINTKNKTYYNTHKQEIKEYYNTHKQEIKAYGKDYRNAHKEERKAYGKDYRNAHKEEIKDYRNAHKEEIKVYMKEYKNAHKEDYRQYRRKNYNRTIENIKKIRNGKIDELSNEQLLSVQSLMRQIHKQTTSNSIHGLCLGDKNNNDIYDPNNLEAFKTFLKSQVGLNTISQIDFTELDNMHFDFNVIGDEEKFDNSYFNNDSMPNENYQQDNNDQPINTQKEQAIDKYGFPTYGHKPNMTNDEELFALNHAHDFNEQSI